MAEPILRQTSFAAGMWRPTATERIPADGAFDIENGFVGEVGEINRRGGSEWVSELSTAPATSLRWVWSGFLGPSPYTLVGHANGIEHLASDDGPLVPLVPSAFFDPTRAVTIAGRVFIQGGITFNSSLVFTGAVKVAPYYAVAAGRLLAGKDDRVDFSAIGDPNTFGATDFHLIPDGARIIAMEGLRDACVVFTTSGVFVISGLSNELTDPDGNVQHRIDRYSRDLVLWGDVGIAGFEGGVVVPGRDGVYVMSLGVTSEAPQAFRLISQPVARMYRNYVESGAIPGGATVYRGYYILPIRFGGEVIDTLVCKIDAANAPWSRLTGMAGQVHQWTRLCHSGQLIGAPSAAARILRAGFFEPGFSAKDADGSDFDFAVETRGVAVNGGGEGTMTKTRLHYDLLGPGVTSPTITASVLEGTFRMATALTGAAPETNMLLEAVPYAWHARHKGRYVSLRFVCDDAADELTVRGVEVHARASGRI